MTIAAPEILDGKPRQPSAMDELVLALSANIHRAAH
jgi:hypothetical protein